MSQSVTYIRVNINGEWTKLGIIADEDNIKEHFEFVQGLLKEKKRADKYEGMWKSLKDLMEVERFQADKHGRHDEYDIYDELISEMEWYEQKGKQ